MGCCSSKFEGEGRTLGSAPAPVKPAPSQGQRLGSGSSPAPQSNTPTASANADREARAKAAEERIKSTQSKGAPTQGKLSKQLEQQRANPHAGNDDDAPQRVVVSSLSCPHAPLSLTMRF